MELCGLVKSQVNQNGATSAFWLDGTNADISVTVENNAGGAK